MEQLNACSRNFGVVFNFQYDSFFSPQLCGLYQKGIYALYLSLIVDCLLQRSLKIW